MERETILEITVLSFELDSALRAVKDVGNHQDREQGLFCF